MHPMLNIATRAARSAGQLISRSFERFDTLTVNQKGRYDFVTEIDNLAEQEIINTIRKAYPSHGFLGEESGQSGTDEFLWIIDPLDGTSNFVRGLPHFCISIGFQHKGRLEQAVIYDPIRQELFTATRGSGAQCNNRRIRVSTRHSFEGAVINAGLPLSSQKGMNEALKLLQHVAPKLAGLRRTGSAALDLAYVASGRLDAYWDMGLKPWDLAAGSLLVKEAGGLVSDCSGAENYLHNGHIACANPKLFKFVLQAVQPMSEYL